LLLQEVAPTLRSFGPGFGKQALAKAPRTPLPDIISQRAKTGFGVPTGQWIANQQGSDIRTKGEASRAWALSLLKTNVASTAPVPSMDAIGQPS
jgi:asparagine synthase (glutamine-hydrolysing)